jgi:hypothetical protein
MMIARLRGKPTSARQYRPDFPASLEAVLMKSLESEPEDRYPNALEFGKALLEASGAPALGAKVAHLLK